MSSSWQRLKLVDFVKLQRGHDLPEHERKSGDVPIMGSFGITGYHNVAKVKGPGVTIGRSGASIGVVCYVSDDYWPLNTALYVTDFNGNNALFAYYFLKTLNLTNYNSGSAQPSLNRNYIYPMQVKIPPYPEQHVIAMTLSDVDTLIASLDKLIAKKRDIKQATMQRLLSGKMRLPGFGGEWEVKKLGEIGEKFVNGGTPSTQKPEYWQGNIPWITGADFIDQKITEIRRFITSEAVKNSSTNIVERGNLLLVTRTGVGKLAVAPFDVAISQDITGVYVKKGQALVEYLFHYFNYHSESLRSLNQGTSIAGITRETLLSTNLCLPSFLEQKAIANFLTDMDAEIATLEQKRDKTRALKQGMMQVLLTGKTRLI